MNNLPKILLMVGAVVLAFLLGVVVGRHHQADSPTDPAAASSVQISTQAPPPPAPAASTKLPTVTAPPPAAPVVKVDPTAQVDDDAAAVGMTTRDEPDAATTPPSEPEAQPKAEPAPN